MGVAHVYAWDVMGLQSHANAQTSQSADAPWPAAAAASKSAPPVVSISYLSHGLGHVVLAPDLQFGQNVSFNHIIFSPSFPEDCVCGPDCKCAADCKGSRCQCTCSDCPGESCKCGPSCKCSCSSLL